MKLEWVARFALIVALVGCGPTSMNPWGGAPNQGGVNCARACAYALECLGQDESGTQACVNGCTANPNVMAGVEQATCDQIMQAAAQNGGVQSPGGTGGTTGGCSADCTGCWHDGSSCTAYNLGMQCEACCCR